VSQREGDLERVDLVRGRDHAARLGRRQRAAGGIRQVLLRDRRAHGLGIPGQPGIFGADVALELWKLAHELRGLVRLGQASGFERRIAAAEAVNEPPKPIRLVREGPGAGEEDDRVEAARELLDPGGDVTLEGERGVVEPSFEHGFVPRADRVRVAAVRDDGEPVAAEREVPLV
jgi:hypothetical protein